MEDRYYIVLTTGAYSDYQIAGLYYSDHSIDQVEFNVLVKEYKAQYALKRNEYLASKTSVGYGLNLEDQEKWNTILKWCDENDPETVFVKKHNLVTIDYQEFNC